MNDVVFVHHNHLQGSAMCVFVMLLFCVYCEPLSTELP